MAFDSRTDRHKVTWEKKVERTRRAKDRNTSERWEGKREATRNWREYA